MKIRTAENLADAIDADLIWRKKELATLKFAIGRSRTRPRLLNATLRAGVALLYAHWEGFLKASSEFYLEFVSRQGITNLQLADNFLALSARKSMHDMASSSRVSQSIELVDFFRRRMDEPADVPYKDTVKTRSNLNSDVLRDLSISVGVDYSLFATKSTLIDEKLLHKRNNVAHGQFLDMDAKDFEETFSEVTAMLETWRNELENACATKRYLANNVCP